MALLAVYRCICHKTSLVLVVTETEGNLAGADDSGGCVAEIALPPLVIGSTWLLSASVVVCMAVLFEVCSRYVPC